MYDVTVLSIFRQSESYLDRYFRQVEELFALRAAPCHAIWLEGDSSDRTYARLQEQKERMEGLGHHVTLVKFDTGGPYWGSVPHADRWLQLATCWNQCLSFLSPCRHTICVESDLIWDARVPQSILAKLSPRHPVISPMLMIDRSEDILGEEWFYDTWGFSIEGKKFRNTFPYYPIKDDNTLMKVTTSGGMIVSTYEVQRTAEWDTKDCIMKFPPKYNVYMDKGHKIYHPFPKGWSEYGPFKIFALKLKHKIFK